MNKKVLFPLLGNKHIEIYRDIYIHTHTQHYLLKFEVVNLLLYYKKKKKIPMIKMLKKENYICHFKKIHYCLSGSIYLIIKLGIIRTLHSSRLSGHIGPEGIKSNSFSSVQEGYS